MLSKHKDQTASFRFHSPQKTDKKGHYVLVISLSLVIIEGYINRGWSCDGA